MPESARPGNNGCVREWLVGGALIEADDEILLVRNVRRTGRTDWSPPGGVIETASGESVLEGLSREVNEETNLVVSGWSPLLYEVTAEAPDLGWIMRVEVYAATEFAGEVAVGDDPDGIVTAAAFVGCSKCDAHLEGSHAWVREPLLDFLDQRWSVPRTYRYRLDGRGFSDGRIVRL